MAVIARDAQRDVLFWRRRERLGNGVGIASPPIRLQSFRIAAPSIDSARVARRHAMKSTGSDGDDGDLRQGLDAPNNEAVGVRILSVPCPATARQQRAARVDQQRKLPAQRRGHDDGADVDARRRQALVAIARSELAPRVAAEQVDLGPLDAARVGTEDARMVVAAGDRDHTAYVLYDPRPRHVALRVVPEPAVGSAAPAIRNSVEGRHEVVLLAAGHGPAPRLGQSLDGPRLRVVKEALVHLTRLG